MDEFVIVAAEKGVGSLKVDVSIDGETFADARFPPNFNVPNQEAYTVLTSDTHAVFLHVTESNKLGGEYGSIIKSNSNGISYVLSLRDVNRNTDGYVDFEKMQGIEGIAVVNIVTNVEEAAAGAKKRLKTKITHNDGGAWGYLQPPENDSEGKSYDCSGGDVSFSRNISCSCLVANRFKIA